MVNTALVYQTKFQKTLHEAYVHLARIDEAFADQIIYRFSKARDTIGAKLFKAFLLYQGENVDRPFLDILNELEKLHIVDVEEWFVLREIRNDIAHDYEDNQDQARHSLNNIYQYRGELRSILVEIEQKTGALTAK